MSFGRLLGKHAWIGLALAVAMLLLSVMVGGILVVRGVIPAEGMTLGCCRLWTGGGSRRLCSWKGEGRPVCGRGISFAVWCHVDRGAGNI